MKTLFVTALAAIGAFAVPASAQSDRQAGQAAEADARLAEYVATGETDTCLSLRRVEHLRPLDDSRFLVETRGGGVFLNTVRGRCQGAADAFTYLKYRTSGSQLCRGEIVEVLDRSVDTLRGSCALGEFERLEPAPEPAAAG